MVPPLLLDKLLSDNIPCSKQRERRCTLCQHWPADQRCTVESHIISPFLAIMRISEQYRTCTLEVEKPYENREDLVFPSS